MKDVFKAIADPTRRQILLMVSSEPTNVNTIAEKFNMTRPAVSKHLKVLEDNGLLVIQNSDIDGRQRNCYAQLEALKEIETFIRQLEKFWSSKLNNLGSYLDKKHNKKK
jgi:DNA-binding transcriptional ArsR family regulator